LNDVFIEKYNLTTQKFNWEENNIKLPELSNDDICYMEISDENLENYNNYFNNINNNINNISNNISNINITIKKLDKNVKNKTKEIENDINKISINLLNLKDKNNTSNVIQNNNTNNNYSISNSSISSNDTFINNKLNSKGKKTFFIKEEKYENLTYFSFNILKSSFSKGLNLINNAILKSNINYNSTINLNINKEKKDISLSFLELNCILIC
jgi:hypothetical protein